MNEEKQNLIPRIAGLPESSKNEMVNWEPDVMAMLLADKRSENTRRAYRHDIACFFREVYEIEPSAERLRQFLALNTAQMTAAVLHYKQRLMEAKRSESTVNRRLSALKSLIKLARRVGATEADLQGNIDAEKVITYRDTRGIRVDQARLLLKQPDRTTLKGKRDFALLLLLLENALRRAEVVGMKVQDYEPEANSVWIQGKGRGTQRERITLSAQTVIALDDYLSVRGEMVSSTDPLFISVSPAAFGKPLTTDGLYKIVQEVAQGAGLNVRLSPHRLRHTAITMALDASGGDIRYAQRLSRHVKMETLQIYDDNRTDMQGKMTNLLSQILHDED